MSLRHGNELGCGGKILPLDAPKAEERPRCVPSDNGIGQPRATTCANCGQAYFNDEPPICPGPEKKDPLAMRGSHNRPGTDQPCNYLASGFCNKCGWIGPELGKPVEAAPVEPEPPKPEPRTLPKSVVDDLLGLVGSERNRWERSDPKTSEHWGMVYTHLAAYRLLLGAEVQPDAPQCISRETFERMVEQARSTWPLSWTSVHDMVRAALKAGGIEVEE